MSFIVNWAGTVTKSPDASTLWSNQGSTFTPAKNYPTYFPLPSAYRSAISAVSSYTVPTQQANRPDLIATTLYGAEEYWWLVLWFNGFLDPFTTVPAGTVLLVADLTAVNSVLKT